MGAGASALSHVGRSVGRKYEQDLRTLEEVGKIDVKPRSRRLSYYRNDPERALRKLQQAGPEVDWFDFLVHTELCTMNYSPFNTPDATLFDDVVRMMDNLRVPKTLKKSSKELVAFVYDVYSLMQNKAPYHNFSHVADITQYLYTLLLATHLAKRLKPIELAAAIFAAVCHDLDHPGLSNVYQTSEHTELWQRHAESPLESHHFACFEALIAKHGMLEHLDDESRARFVHVVRAMILATDMAKHQTLMSTIRTRLEDDAFNPIASEDGIDLTLMIALKCADISNQARPWRVANRWNEAVYQEFYHEGDLNRKAGRTVAPLQDRETNVIPKSTCGFIGFIVAPLFEAFVAIMTRVHAKNVDVDSSVVEECLVFLHKNKDRYELQASGHHVDVDEIEDELVIFSEDLRHGLRAQGRHSDNAADLPGVNAGYDGMARQRRLSWLRRHYKPIDRETLFPVDIVKSATPDDPQPRRPDGPPLGEVDDNTVDG